MASSAMELQLGVFKFLPAVHPETNANKMCPWSSPAMQHFAHVYLHTQTRGVAGIFFWGGKVIFLIFSPGWILFSSRKFPLRTPKTNFRHFEKWKAKKKKKKRSSPHFWTFSSSSFHFQFSTFPFTIFLHFFSIFPLFHFFLAAFFLIGQQKFPGHKSLGGTLHPLPHLLRHWLRLQYICTDESWLFWDTRIPPIGSPCQDNDGAGSGISGLYLWGGQI